MIDERFDILSWRGTYLNISHEFSRSCSSIIEDPSAIILKRNSEFIHGVFKESARRLGDYLEDESPGSRIILHEAYASDRYVKDEDLVFFGDDVRDKNNIMNGYLKCYYDLLKSSLKVSEVIQVPDEYRVACSSHRWGLAPFHFVDKYYEEFMEILVASSDKKYFIKSDFDMFECERFTDFIQAHVEKTDENRILYDKEMTKDIALKSGVEVPKTLSSFKSLYEVPFGKMPDKFVLKSTCLSSKHGVYLLEHNGSGEYFEHLRGEVFTKKEITDDLIRLGVDKRDFIVEEFVSGEQAEGEIPYDYKLYCFDGSIRFILQINRNVKPEEMCFFDGGFNPISEHFVKSDYKIVQEGIHHRPKNFLTMIQTALSVSKEADRPFVSVDMYTDGKNCYVGELTGGPGGPYFGAAFRFSEEFDLVLGAEMVKSYMRRGWVIPKISNKAPVYQT